MRKWWPTLLIAIGATAVVLRLVVLRTDPVSVRVALVERAVVESTITNSKAGTIRARRRARLSAEVGGRVVEITRREGEWIEQGEVLLRLNDATPVAQLRLARASLRVADAARNEACVAAGRARRELDRKRNLADRNIVSDDVLDALESADQAAAASCRAVTAERDKAAAAIVAAEADLAKFEIRSPFDGVIAEVNAELGEWITPSPPLLTAPAVLDVIDPASLYVSAPMDEVDSASIQPGQLVKITVDSRPGESFPGKMTRVAPYVLDVEAQNRTVEVEVEFVDTEFASTLLPGTSADVEVVLEVHDGVLRVPTSALLNGRRVLLAEDGVLVERSVEIGLKNWDYAEVLSGLDEGQPVVVSLDRLEVKAGVRFEIEDSTPIP
ncbi:MAG: efflux RND transporter periplasmic adaptor subunit [Myxococcota bacterium]